MNNKHQIIGQIVELDQIPSYFMLFLVIYIWSYNLCVGWLIFCLKKEKFKLIK